MSSKFYIWNTYIKLLSMSEYGFCPMNDNQDCLQIGYPLFTTGHCAGPLFEFDCSSEYDKKMPQSNTADQPMAP